jgi:hypothetical protein
MRSELEYGVSPGMPPARSTPQEPCARTSTCQCFKLWTVDRSTSDELVRYLERPMPICVMLPDGRWTECLSVMDRKEDGTTDLTFVPR